MPTLSPRAKAILQATVLENPFIPGYAKEGLRRNLKQIDLLTSEDTELLYGGAAGGGKALCLETPIPTPNGWRTMGELQAGDYVFGADGKPTRILQAFDVLENRECYELEFDTGDKIIADAEHLWHTFTARDLVGLTRKDPEWRAARRAKRASRATGKRSAAFTAAIVARNRACPTAATPAPTGGVRTTREILETLTTAKGRKNHAIPIAKPLERTTAELPMEPYLFGLWLGDGTSQGYTFTSADAEILQAWRDGGFKVTKYPNPYTYGIGGINAVLRPMGVLKNKHVPRIYLEASAAQRLALLQGLMDTDGYANPDGSVEFDNTRKELAHAVLELVLSLGWKPTIKEGRAKLKGVDCGPKWRVTWRPTEPVFRIVRKASRHRTDNLRRTQQFRYIVAVRPVPSVPVRCISVDAADRLFLAGRGLIPTHNSFGLLMAATQYATVPGYSALILRRTFKMLEKSDSIYSLAKSWWLGDPRVHHNADLYRFTFPSGATIEFGHLEHDKDKYNYQGGAWRFIGFEELTQFVEPMFLYLFSRLRGPAESKIPLRLWSTANPGGSGHAFVKARYIDAETREEGARFISAKLTDNGNLDQEGYRKNLSRLDSLTRRQLEDGDWNAVEGARFKAQWFANRWDFDEDGQHVLLKDGRGTQRFLLSKGGRQRFGTADGAASSKTSADDSAFAAWLTTPMNDLLSFGFQLEKIEIPEQPEMLEKFYRRHNLQWCGVEGVASNVALLQFAQRRQMVIKRLIPKAPVQGAGKDKLSRAFPAIALAEQGRIWLPSPKAAAIIGYPLKRVIDQLVTFTGNEDEDAHDDIVDNFSYAVEAYNAFPHVAKSDPSAMGVGGLPGMMPPTGPMKKVMQPRSLTNPQKPTLGVGGIGPKRY